MEYTFCANIVKKDPGGASQISLATAGTTSPNLEHGIKEISVKSRLPQPHPTHPGSTCTPWGCSRRRTRRGSCSSRTGTRGCRAQHSDDRVARSPFQINLIVHQWKSGNPACIFRHPWLGGTWGWSRPPSSSRAPEGWTAASRCPTSISASESRRSENSLN